MGIIPKYLYFIALALVFSLFAYKKRSKKQFYLKLFLPFLLITFVIESYSIYLWYIGGSNQNLYNYFTTFEFCFYQLILSYIITNHRIKKAIIYILIFYLPLTLINILLIQRGKFHSITYSVGCLLIVIFCIYYFFELFRLPNSINLKKEPSFWVCSGLLFYYCCSLPLFGAINFFSQIPKFLLDNMQIIVNIMNILLYTSFTIAFLCRLRIPKYTLQ